MHDLTHTLYNTICHLRYVLGYFTKSNNFSSIGGGRLHNAERDVAQSLERGALPMSLFKTPLGTGFLEKYNVSPLSILGHFSEKYDVSPLSILKHCFDVLSLGQVFHPHMLHLIQV